MQNQSDLDSVFAFGDYHLRASIGIFLKLTPQQLFYVSAAYLRTLARVQTLRLKPLTSPQTPETADKPHAVARPNLLACLKWPTRIPIWTALKRRDTNDYMEM